MDQPNDWVPLAGQAIGVVGQASERVQITVTIAVTVIVLAALLVWYLRGRHFAAPSTPPIETMDTVPAEVLVTVTEEFARQVTSLRDAVDKLSQALTGCRDCPYYQSFQKEQSHDVA